MEKMKLLAIIFLFVIQQCNLFVEANNHHQKNQMVSQLKREVQRLREKDEALEKEVQKVREKDEVLEELIIRTQLSFSEEVIHLRKEVEEELVNKAKFLTNPCQHGKPFYENHFKCQCDQGWTGDKCQVDIDECQANNQCKNGGICTNLLGNYTCDCSNTGYRGKNCEIIEDACTSQVPGGLCKKLGNGECWCRDAKIDECKCTGGIPSGHGYNYTCPGGKWHYGSHAGYELCGYQPGYNGTYFPATQAAATAFGYGFSSSWPSCAKNSLVSDSYISPLDCPKHKSHCRNGFCNWLTQKDAWNKKDCGVQVCCTAFVRCVNMEADDTVKTTTESNYVVTTLPPMDSSIAQLLPEGAKKIYQGQGWKYFKVPISKGPFNITGKVLSTRCREVGMETPCSCAKRHLAQKACVETAHTSGSKTSNMIHLQSAIGDKGYNSYDEDHMAQTFSYSLDHRENKNDYPTKEDGACGYNINDCQCTGVAGQKTVSNGQYFALCALKI